MFVAHGERSLPLMRPPRRLRTFLGTESSVNLRSVGRSCASSKNTSLFFRSREKRRAQTVKAKASERYMRSGILLLHFLSFVCAKDSFKRTLYDEEYAKRLLDLSAGAYFPDPIGCVRRCVELIALVPILQVFRTLPKSEQWSLLTSTENNCDSVGTSCRYYIIASNITRTLAVVFRGTQTPAQLFVEGWQSLNPKVNFYGAGKVWQMKGQQLRVTKLNPRV